MSGLLSAKFLVVLAVIMVVLGPEKLPEASRTIGRLLTQFREVSSGLRQELHQSLHDSDLAEPIQELRSSAMTLRGAASDWRTAAVGMVASPLAPRPAGSAPVTPGSAPAGRAAAAPMPLPEAEFPVPPGDPSLN